MKMLNLCLALVFSLSLCFAGAPDTSFAASSDTKSTVSKTAKSAKQTTKAASKVDINSADKQTLTQLPGVGPATADAIIKYRKANGKFKSANDLLNVKGIGEKTLKKMKPLLKF
ncbi:ComEA family DNA-binding protein [Desulforhopalus sp. 52FAK]